MYVELILKRFRDLFGLHFLFLLFVSEHFIEAQTKLKKYKNQPPVDYI